MLKVVGCFAGAHDLRLVVLAALICSLASFTAVQLLGRARASKKRGRVLWIVVTATACGFGIWATHFIAMLAFDPGVPSGYDLSETVLSLVLAMVLTGLGFAVAVRSRLTFDAALGGAVVGGGIATMHYTGMAAFRIGGHIVWDAGLAAASILIGAVFGAAALVVALRRSSLAAQLGAACLLVAAICGHHFTAMGAATIVPDPTVAVTPSAVPTSWLAVAVAVASVAVLLFAVAALALDARDRRWAVRQDARLRNLANAAIEGLLVCRGLTILSANESFARTVGLDAADLDGEVLERFLPTDIVRLALASPNQPVETDLKAEDGSTVPVEVIARHIGDLLQQYALAIRDVRARRKAEQEIQFLALHDGLTGLANRTNFASRLDREMQVAEAKRTKLAVLCLDLDRFKEVNDLFGHAAGDRLLQTVARVVTDLLGQDQMMGRLGGDEFAVLAPVEHAVAAGRLAERVIVALRTEGQSTTGPWISTSIGIAVYPEDAQDQALLLAHADTALYRAKQDGRGTYRFYEDRLGAEVRTRRALEHDLRHAVARGEMQVVYQPQHNVATREVVGFEALLRWYPIERGPVPPSEFIPIAEESGIILQLGEWVLRETCREAAGWRKPLSIAVNVSAVQIHHTGFVQLLHEILFQSGLAPERLELEVTETALVRDPERARSMLRQIKLLGVRIAMDDFGTGYSSLANLRHYPFDKIKVDRSFIESVDTNEQTAAIVRSVLGLGRGLGLPVLAEGVETSQELAFLANESCQEVQGYLMGRPAPIAEFAAYTGAGPAEVPTAA